MMCEHAEARRVDRDVPVVAVIHNGDARRLVELPHENVEDRHRDELGVALGLHLRASRTMVAQGGGDPRLRESGVLRQLQS